MTRSPPPTASRLALWGTGADSSRPLGNNLSPHGSPAVTPWHPAGQAGWLPGPGRAAGVGVGVRGRSGAPPALTAPAVPGRRALTGPPPPPPPARHVRGVPPSRATPPLARGLSVALQRHADWPFLKGRRGKGGPRRSPARLSPLRLAVAAFHWSVQASTALSALSDWPDARSQRRDPRGEPSGKALRHRGAAPQSVRGRAPSPATRGSGGSGSGGRDPARAARPPWVVLRAPGHPARCRGLELRRARAPSPRPGSPQDPGADRAVMVQHP